jgi:hypothetical protein
MNREDIKIIRTKKKHVYTIKHFINVKVAILHYFWKEAKAKMQTLNPRIVKHNNKTRSIIEIVCNLTLINKLKSKINNIKRNPRAKKNFLDLAVEIKRIN